jgi:hypothetical protein
VTDWNLLTPAQECLARLEIIEAGPIWVNSASQPPEAVLFLQDRAGGWISLSWDYQDVGPGFEIFCLDIGEPSAPGPADRAEYARLAPFADIRLVLRTTWIRPASPGEVPPDYQQTIEASGRLSDVPANAIVAGVTLDGVVFLAPDGNPVMLISTENATTYRVLVKTDDAEIRAYVHECDAVSTQAFPAWAAQLRL